ncbi:MAG TPA: hypothetical protein DCP28_27985 [Cytophagales bacterium]|nr:hypothetical protein [Cytophagales bacterium]
MKRIFTLLGALLLLSGLNDAQAQCANGFFDLEITHGLPDVVYPGHTYEIRLKASNFPDNATSRDVQYIRYSYYLRGFWRNLPSNGYDYFDFREVLIAEDEFNWLKKNHNRYLEIPELEINWENKFELVIRAEMATATGINIFCSSYTYVSQTSEEMVVCTPPHLKIVHASDGWDQIGSYDGNTLMLPNEQDLYGIPIGTTSFDVKAAIRQDWGEPTSVNVGDMELTWNVIDPAWVLDKQVTSFDETVNVTTDGLVSNGRILLNYTSTTCSENVSRFTATYPIARYVPRPDVVSMSGDLCEITSTRIEVTRIARATGYLWELITGPVSWAGQSGNSIVTADPWLELDIQDFGDVHVRVRAITPIDDYIESSFHTLLYPVEDEKGYGDQPNGARNMQKLYDLRWRNINFWAGGTGPVQIRFTGSDLPVCRGPIWNYDAQVIGATNYEWQIEGVGPFGLVPHVAQDIFYPQDGSFYVDGHRHMYDGDQANFVVRLTTTGVNDCPPTTGTVGIGYTYHINRPPGSSCAGPGGGLDGPVGDVPMPSPANPGLAGLPPELKLYPNPAQHTLQLEVPEGAGLTLQLRNTLQQQVLTVRLTPGQNTVNLAELTNGMYTATFTNAVGEVVKTEPLMVLR